MSAKKDVQKPGRGTAAVKKKSPAFTADEIAAMKERARELEADARRGTSSQKAALEGAAEVLAKIEEMTEPDRAMARRLHAIIQASMPSLTPRTWYGMPAYARDGSVVCFFKPAQKFKARYATLGFSDKARLDDGAMWPTEFALKELTATGEERIVALVKRAVS